MPDLCVEDGQTLLFIGDSITDCGRRDSAPPLGDGYVALVTEMITALYPDREIHYMNKGIGGNRVTDLRERWTDDVTSNAPDWLSVMIGINDLHSHLGDPEQGVGPELFSKCYDEILGRAAGSGDTKGMVLLEPFYISVDRQGDAFRSQVLALLPEYIAVVHAMAEKYDARLVATQEAFQEQLRYRDADTFCAEPVHPYRSGHIIIATELLKALED